MPSPLSPEPEDFTQLLSEIYNPDKLANSSRTRDFLEAGERLLRNDLLRDACGPADAKGYTPFEEVLAWLTRDRVVEEAQRAWDEQCGKGSDARPTEAAHKYRWRYHAGYLRDLVVTALFPRMKRPKEIGYASKIIDTVHGGRRLSSAIAEITAREVQALMGDPAFRLQLIFQATLAHDDRLAYALHLIDKANVEAWTEFVRQSYDKLGLQPRKGTDFRQLGCALHAAGEGVMFRAMLASRADHSPPTPSELLNLIAKALVIATVDLGDGKTLDEILDQFAQQHRPEPDEHDDLNS